MNILPCSSRIFAKILKLSCSLQQQEEQQQSSPHSKADQNSLSDESVNNNSKENPKSNVSNKFNVNVWKTHDFLLKANKPILDNSQNYWPRNMFKDRFNKQKDTSYKSLPLAGLASNGADGNASASLEYLNLIVQSINSTTSKKDFL